MASLRKLVTNAHERDGPDPAREEPIARGSDYPQYELFNSLIFRANRLAGLYFKSSSRDYMRAFGMGIPEVRLINIIGGMPWANAQELVEISSMDKGLVSRSLASLTKRGYLRRMQDDDDRRCFTLKLTATGQRIYQQIKTTKQQRHLRTVAGLTPEECRLLYRLMDKAIATAQLMADDTAGLKSSPPRKDFENSWPASDLLKRVRSPGPAKPPRTD